MKRIKITPRARLDLMGIWEYIAADSVRAADCVIAEIEAEFQKIAEMPGIGHTRPKLDPRCRVWSVYSYLIVYRPDTAPIQILRVVSGYRDLSKIFNETKAVPTMITIAPKLLKLIDASAKKAGLSRSQFLANAARRELSSAE